VTNRWRRGRFFGMVRTFSEDSLRRLIAVVAFTSVTAAVWAVACGNQGEGGQCNTLDDNSGDNDCSDGDFCMAASQASGVWASYGNDVPGFGYCCPTDRTQATTPQCSLAGSVPNGNQGLPPDSGTSSGSTSDGASDAPSDSPEAVDAPADAPLDASGD
jgi:hypothetical protein